MGLALACGAWGVCQVWEASLLGGRVLIACWPCGRCTCVARSSLACCWKQGGECFVQILAVIVGLSVGRNCYEDVLHELVSKLWRA